MNSSQDIFQDGVELGSQSCNVAIIIGTLKHFDPNEFRFCRFNSTRSDLQHILLLSFDGSLHVSDYPLNR